MINNVTSFRLIPIELLKFRKELIIIDEDELNSIKDSIEQYSIINPIHVRPIMRNDYEILDGNKRIVAIKQLSIERVPCIIHEFMDDKSAREFLGVLKVIKNADPIHEKEVLNAINELEKFIQETEKILNNVCTTLSGVAQDVQYLQDICTVYLLEYVESVSILRDILKADTDTLEFYNSSQKLQTHLLNMQQRLVHTNGNVTKCEETVLNLYNKLSEVGCYYKKLKWYSNGVEI
jgi:hypothetical protein